MERLNEKLTDVQLIHRELQSAIDHYPRLAAFRFSLRQPEVDALRLPEEAVVQFIHALQQMTHQYIEIRQSEGKAVPPTMLRILWGVGSSRDIQVMLMLNLSTFCCRQQQEGEETVLALIRQAWAATHGDTPFTTEPQVFFPSEPCFLACRTIPAKFTAQHEVLRSIARQLPAPVAFYRSNV
ncbi:inovirus-type Gp2 protein [Serratia sp. JSRIV001]|uniref:YagK/YfjJ domain-containing protein n=1 Tax=unclassified Serratia (in: enterobacteria) TaxID=2647522 RepID=UPI001CBC78ED|nr:MULTISPECIES: inovirus-type Gp2 protein [unclassified Serratia (in: enterobacteria)]UAN45236.1 inovirus-type Gp2 protein [Serratia sp. JSRIV001]UAN50710.1 inovirus-type Gp2 protein [Serratia sp. JSRIV002]UAN56675.1 inovirus-type Gp2 protein [Serratia sp. JSRIV004]